MTTVLPNLVADGVPSHGIDLRLGDYREVLADVECDLLLVDAPYSDRTHDGMQVGELFDPLYPSRRYQRAGLSYAHWTTEDVDGFADAWAPRTRGWFVSITDHLLAPAWVAALERHKLYVFQPLPFVEVGKQPRLTGDGPASWTCWIVVARPRRLPYSAWGSLPGAYVPPKAVIGNRGGRLIKGGKPLWLMQALVRDYSRPGDLVCDPCAGAGTTLLAAAIEGRRAVGAEMMAEHHALAHARFARGFTPSLFTE